MELHGKLLPEPNTPPKQSSCLIHGLGGLGKTQIALEYTYRYRDSYDVIFWLRAGSSADLVEGILAIARKMKLDKGTVSNDVMTESVRNWFEETGELLACNIFCCCLHQAECRWLLVFDNVEKSSDLIPFWPRTKHGAVLLTSQLAHLRTLHEIQVEPFTTIEGSALLSRLLPKSTSGPRGNDLEMISEELGGLPLAIVHVAGYMAETGVSSAEMLKLLAQRRDADRIFTEDSEVTSHYEKNLAAVWDFALDELARHDKDALTLMQVLAMLSPDAAPEMMFVAKEAGPDGPIPPFKDHIRYDFNVVAVRQS